MSLIESLRIQSRVRHPLCLAIALACASGAIQAATITVNDAGDAAAPAGCTLREAIGSVNNGIASSACSSVVSGTFGNADTVIFDNSLVNATITLSQGELSVTAPLTIQGSGQTVDAQYQSRVVYVDYSSLDARNLTITGGFANAENGGGVYGYYSTVSLSNVTIMRNTANNGGGIGMSHSTLTLNNVTVASNSAGYGGGGVEVQYNSANMINTTVTGNNAQYGSGIDSDGASITLTNTTLTGNSASNYGGGIRAYNSSDVAMSNSIVSGNFALSNNPDVYLSSVVDPSTATSNYSLLGTALQAMYPNNGNVFGDDPGVDALADNGGPTQTMALRADSLAVDAGSNALIPGGVQYDQRGPGHLRIVSGTVDIGAFEFQPDIIFANGFEPAH